MRSFLLLLFSLMKGCVASFEVKGCKEGWVEFTCKYPKPTGKYNSIVVELPAQSEIQSVKDGMWEPNDRFSLYHDIQNEQLKVAIKQLEDDDFGDYKCKFKAKSNNPKVKIVKDSCQGPFFQTAYSTTKTTITCDYPENKYKSSVKFICKEKEDSICEDILSTNSSPKSNGKFTLTETNRGFSLSISEVSSDDAGVYWCGVKSKEESYRTALRKIQLEVKDITKFKRFPTIGQNFTYWCEYHEDASKKKFICKGEDPSICQPLVSTTQTDMTTGRFSMKENKEKRNITITVRDLRTNDTGTYWCGAESNDRTRSNMFFHRFMMTVVPPKTTSPVSSTQPTSSTSTTSTLTTSTSAHRDGGPQVVITVTVCVAVLLLLFVLILILIYKRFSHSKNTRNGTAAQQIREDYVYEEIQERVQKPDSGNAVTTIYVTANFPTNPSPSLHYSTVNFPKSSDKPAGEALILKPSSSACEYSTVKHKQSPTYSTVYEPSRSPQDPLYSTINKPQWQPGQMSPVRKS